MTDESSFASRLKTIRTKRGYTQSTVADKLGITRPAYTAYESGNREPDFSLLSKLANIYNVSTDYLLGVDIPSWASEKDVMDLEDLLDSNVNMAYGGESLTEAEKQRVKDILTTLFWDKLQKKKEGGGDGKQN